MKSHAAARPRPARPPSIGFSMGAGGHSHTLFYGPQAPAGQPQLPGEPPDLLIDPPTPETAPPVVPYPTNIASGDKTIPVVSAFWGSRWEAGAGGRARVTLRSPLASNLWARVTLCSPFASILCGQAMFQSC